MGSNFTAKVTRHGGLLERLRKHTGTAHVNETEAADEIERLRDVLQFIVRHQEKIGVRLACTSSTYRIAKAALDATEMKEGTQ